MLKKILKVLAEPVKKYVGKKKDETVFQAICRSLSSTFALIAMGCISANEPFTSVFVLATTASAFFYTYYYMLHHFDSMNYKTFFWKPFVGYFSIFFSKVSGIVIFIATNLIARGFGIEAPIKTDIAGSIATCLLCYLGGVIFIIMVQLFFVAAVHVIYFVKYSIGRIFKHA